MRISSVEEERYERVRVHVKITTRRAIDAERNSRIVLRCGLYAPVGYCVMITWRCVIPPNTPSQCNSFPLSSPPLPPSLGEEKTIGREPAVKSIMKALHDRAPLNRPGLGHPHEIIAIISGVEPPFRGTHTAMLARCDTSSPLFRLHREMAIRSRDFSNRPRRRRAVAHPCRINSDLNGFETASREIENATSVEKRHYLRPSLRCEVAAPRAAICTLI